MDATIEPTHLVREALNVTTDELNAAFESFYSSSFRTVLAATTAFTSDPETAREATQEAFARALTHWRRIGDQQWATGWVITTAINHSRRIARRSHRPLPQENSSVETSPSGRIELVEALRSLPVRRRTAVVLFYIGDHSVADVAHVMGLSEGAVRAHLTLARKDLRTHLKEHDD